MEDRRQDQLQRHNAARRKSTKLGRPQDPKRQAMLAERRERRERKERAKRAQDLTEDAVWAPRIEELRGLGVTNVELHANINEKHGSCYWHVPRGVPLPSWVVDEVGWSTCVPSDVPDRHRRALGKTKHLYRGRDFRNHSDACESIPTLREHLTGTLIWLELTHALRSMIAHRNARGTNTR